MRLDKASMNKLFDLMIMLTKYQLTVSTGPREVILLTLNHIDAMHEIVTDENAHECINLVHQMLIDLYGNMTMGQVWHMRNECLKVLGDYCIRVSVLLRLGLQNGDGSFNIRSSEYDEKYTKYQDMLNGIKLNDTDCENCTIGSFALFGNRGTLLGRNVYSPSYGQSPESIQNKLQPLKDVGIRNELRMLEAQLGVEGACGKTFNLSSFAEDIDFIDDQTDTCKKVDSQNEGEMINLVVEDLKSNKEYKNTLSHRYADFVVSEQESSTDLLELLDKVE
ncbi:protein OSCP1-like isoform X2 [Athalia rosae]|nr:protein OSCP1-like isoform X2 [Athalia rosae]